MMRLKAGFRLIIPWTSATCASARVPLVTLAATPSVTRVGAATAPGRSPSRAMTSMLGYVAPISMLESSQAGLFRVGSKVTLASISSAA